MYPFLVDDSSEHKKAKDVNKNVETVSHNKYKDVLLNKKCIRWIESKAKIIEYEPMKLTKFLYHALMITYTSKTMVMMDELLAIWFNY